MSRWDVVSRALSKIKEQVTTSGNNANPSVRHADKTFLGWLAELEHRFLRIYNNYNSLWVAYVEEILNLQDAVLKHRRGSCKAEDESQDKTFTSPEDTTEQDRLQRKLSIRRCEVYGLDFVGATDKAIAEIQTLLKRWRQRISFSNSKLDDTANNILDDIAALVLEVDVGRCIDNDGQFYLDKDGLLRLLDRYRGPQESLDTWIDKIVNVISSMHRRLDFPWKRIYLDKHAERLFDNLSAYTPHVIHDRFRIRRMRTDAFLPVEFEGKFTSLVVETEGGHSEYLQMDILADNFTEVARMAARRKDQQQSPIEQWNSNASFLRRVLTQAMVHAVVATLPSEASREIDRRRLPQHHIGSCTYNPTFGIGVDPYVLRECVFMNLKECTQFKPSLAKSIMALLRGTRVLDFSAGWGDRLLGAMASRQVQRYFAFDPNRSLRPGHTAMMDRFLTEDRRQRFHVCYEPAESGHIPPGETFDLIFSSPPFFDLEIYTSAKGQSVENMQSVQHWLQDFLFVCMHKFWNVLDPMGYLALHMSDFGKNEICEPMCLFAEACLPRCLYSGIIASYGARGVPRPIYVFQKLPASAPPEGTSRDVRAKQERQYSRQPQAKRHFKRFFPQLSDAGQRLVESHGDGGSADSAKCVVTASVPAMAGSVPAMASSVPSNDGSSCQSPSTTPEGHPVSTRKRRASPTQLDAEAADKRLDNGRTDKTSGDLVRRM
eukprot:m.336517 g.336517  ORF g.336517 m.336517 type:complete len:716 (-) comp20538_c0_seq2:373-2520(-)